MKKKKIRPWVKIFFSLVSIILLVVAVIYAIPKDLDNKELETKEEEMVYDAWQTEPDKDKQSALEDLWDAMIVHAGQGQGVMWGEDDIYGYIRPDETMPDVGEEYTDADEDKWLRVE